MCVWAGSPHTHREQGQRLKISSNADLDKVFAHLRGLARLNQLTQNMEAPCGVQGAPSLPLGDLLDDPFDLAAVDAEFAGDCSLAAACLVSCSYRLLQHWYIAWRRWFLVRHDCRGWVLGALGDRCRCGSVRWSDEEHAEFVGADECHGGPGADQGADGAVVQAVCQVGADGGDDANPKAPGRQWWYRPGTAVGVQDDHRSRPNE